LNLTKDFPSLFDLIGSRVHPEDLPLMSDMIGKAQYAASHFAYEHRIVMPDHSIKHLHLMAHSRRDPEGRLEYIGAVQDVTQRHLAEAALATARAELANAAKISSLGVLTASIAHEVSQPLSGIITNASTCLRMLERDSPNVDGVRDMARLTSGWQTRLGCDLAITRLIQQEGIRAGTGRFERCRT
jgi:signal transduction histidine kinase